MCKGRCECHKPNKKQKLITVVTKFIWRLLQYTCYVFFKILFYIKNKILLKTRQKVHQERSQIRSTNHKDWGKAWGQEREQKEIKKNDIQWKVDCGPKLHMKHFLNSQAYSNQSQAIQYHLIVTKFWNVWINFFMLILNLLLFHENV